MKFITHHRQGQVIVALDADGNETSATDHKSISAAKRESRRLSTTTGARIACLPRSPESIRASYAHGGRFNGR